MRRILEYASVPRRLSPAPGASITTRQAPDTEIQAMPSGVRRANNAMVISHRRKFIFVHVPKTAGTSIIEALGPYLDVVRPAPGSTCRAGRSFAPPPPHLAARHYLEFDMLERAQFDEYFKFAFVRNPWDRMVSEYRYRRHPQRISFAEYLRSRFPEPAWTDEYCHVIAQCEFLFDRDGRQLVDFIGRYEQLAADFAAVCRRLAITATPLRHRNRANSFRRRDNNLLEACRTLRGYVSLRQRRNTFAHYTEYYDAESVERVGHLYRRDIEAFGYRFGS